MGDMLVGSSERSFMVKTDEGGEKARCFDALNLSPVIGSLVGLRVSVTAEGAMMIRQNSASWKGSFEIL